MEEHYLAVEDFARKLLVHRATATRWIKEKKVNAIKVGRRWLIPESEYIRVTQQGKPSENTKLVEPVSTENIATPEIVQL